MEIRHTDNGVKKSILPYKKREEGDKERERCDVREDILREEVIRMQGVTGWGEESDGEKI